MDKFILTNKYRPEFKKEFDSYNEALVWLQRNTHYSWDHAFKFEGWIITEPLNQEITQ